MNNDQDPNEIVHKEITIGGVTYPAMTRQQKEEQVEKGRRSRELEELRRQSNSPLRRLRRLFR